MNISRKSAPGKRAGTLDLEDSLSLIEFGEEQSYLLVTVNVWEDVAKPNDLLKPGDVALLHGSTEHANSRWAVDKHGGVNVWIDAVIHEGNASFNRHDGQSVGMAQNVTHSMKHSAEG